MTWLCLFRVLALALTCKQASKLNKCPIYTGVLYLRMYVRMCMYVYTGARVRLCVAVRSCAFANVSIDMHMREYRRWMSNTNGWMGKIDRHCMLSRHTISRDYYSYLRKFPQLEVNFFFHFKRALEISFSCISCCIFLRYIFDALNIVAYAVSVHEIDFFTKKKDTAYSSLCTA